MIYQPELLESILRTLGFCQLRPDEKVVVYTDSGRPQTVAGLFFAGSVTYGCDAALIVARKREPLAEPPAPAIKAMVEADVVFDVSTETWVFTEATAKILGKGARILQVRGDERRVIDRAPTDEIVRKARAARKLFEGASRLRITSVEGTDLTVRWGSDRLPLAQDGAADIPGELDSLGTAFCNIFPHEDTAEGVVVLNGPVKMTGADPFIAPDPIRITFHNGQVIEVVGGEGARRFRAWLDGVGDPNLRRLAHIGFGYDPRCGPPPKPAETGDFGSWQNINGGVIVAFGANIGLGRYGGTNAARGHSDCTVLCADLYLDDRQIIKEGKFLVPELM